MSKIALHNITWQFQQYTRLQRELEIHKSFKQYSLRFQGAWCKEQVGYDIKTALGEDATSRVDLLFYSMFTIAPSKWLIPHGRILQRNGNI